MLSENTEQRKLAAIMFTDMRALELKPNLAFAHFRYGWNYLSPMGRSDEAITEIKRALELEPLSLITNTNLALAYADARQNDLALAQALKTYDLEPNFIVGRWALSQAYIVNGMYADAIELNERSLQTNATNQIFLRFAGYAYAKSGRRREAEEIIKRFNDIAKTQICDVLLGCPDLHCTWRQGKRPGRA